MSGGPYLFGEAFHKKYLEPRALTEEDRRRNGAGQKQQEDSAQSQTLLLHFQTRLRSNPSLLVINKEDGAAIFRFFMGSPIESGGLRQDHLIFLQAAMMAAIDASARISLIEALWRSTVAPTGLASLSKKLARNILRALYRNARNDDDIIQAKIYTMVSNVIVMQANTAFLEIRNGLDVT